MSICLCVCEFTYSYIALYVYACIHMLLLCCACLYSWLTVKTHFQRTHLSCLTNTSSTQVWNIQNSPMIQENLCSGATWMQYELSIPNDYWIQMLHETVNRLHNLFLSWDDEYTKSTSTVNDRFVPRSRSSSNFDNISYFLKLGLHDISVRFKVKCIHKVSGFRQNICNAVLLFQIEVRLNSKPRPRQHKCNAKLFFRASI